VVVEYMDSFHMLWCFMFCGAALTLQGCGTENANAQDEDAENNEVDMVLSGSVGLSVDDADAFLGNCSHAVAAAVSFFTEAAIGNVSVNCVLARRLGSNGQLRRLGTPIDADYHIRLHGVDAHAAQQKLAGTATIDMQSKINENFPAEKGVTVTRMSPPTLAANAEKPPFEASCSAEDGTMVQHFGSTSSDAYCKHATHALMGAWCTKAWHIRTNREMECKDVTDINLRENTVKSCCRMAPYGKVHNNQINCEAAGRSTIANKDQCQAAAMALGISAPLVEGSFNTLPGGCVVNLFPAPSTQDLFWNEPTDASLNKGCLDGQVMCLCKA